MWKKRVVVMAPRAFDNYVGFIQADIATHNDTVVYLTTRATAYMRGREEAGEDSIRAEKWARDLEDTEHELARTREKVSHLEALYVDIMTCWRNPQDRVVGYVDWAPAIGVSAPPHPFTRDLCIIKLDRAKFKNFLGSVLNLGMFVGSLHSLNRPSRVSPYGGCSSTSHRLHVKICLTYTSSYHNRPQALS